MAANKTDQKNFLPIPAGQAKTIVPNGAQVVDSVGKNPIEDRWNPDRGIPRDPVRKGE